MHEIRAVSLLAALAAGPLDAAPAESPVRFTSVVEPSGWAPVGPQPTSAFGFAVATAGDINGDGYSDVLVGAPGFADGEANEGRVELYLGGAAGLATTAAWSWSPDVAGARLGEAVAALGDVNLDGYQDVLVGAPGLPSGLTPDFGAAYLFLGGSGGLPATPSRTYLGTTAGGRFGQAVAGAGDVNNDGYADLAIGVPAASAQGARGTVHVDHGGAAGPNGIFDQTLTGANQQDRIGDALAAGGDINADGYADLVVGAPRAEAGGVRRGRVFIYPGSGAGIVAAPTVTITGTVDSLELGASVAGVGDVDGDGYADVMIGAPGHDGGLPRVGRAQLHRGSAIGLGAIPAQTFVGTLQNERLGSAVATAGDLDGDGFADAIVGAPGPAGSALPLAPARFYLGSFAGLVAAGTIESALVSTQDFGLAVATAGDVDGDGYAEVIVGDPGDADGGRAFLHEGTAEPWALAAGWPVTGTQFGSLFGHSLAILPHAGFTGLDPLLVIGEPEYDLGDSTMIGRVMFHRVSPTGPQTSPFQSLGGIRSYDSFGFGVVDAGDLNRDGYSDLVVTSPRHEVPGLGRVGALHVYLGGVGGFTLIQTITGDHSGAFIGVQVVGGGDYNGDGFHDILCGAGNADGPASNSGRVWLYLGGPGGTLTPAWTAGGTASGDGFGLVVAWLGDIDGDGLSDFAIGQPSSNAAVLGRVVHVHYGRTTPPAPESAADWTLGGVPPHRSFGSAIAGIGDVNGDGVSDFAVGSPGAGFGGRADVYAGQRGRERPPRSIWSLGGLQTSGYLGWAIAGGGDITGDGIADFLIGEPGWRREVDSGHGRVHLFAGAPFGPSASPVAVLESEIKYIRLGSSFSNVVDIDGNGFADVAIGAPGWASTIAIGRVFMYLGGGPGLIRDVRLTEPGFGGLYRFGPGLVTSVSSVGLSSYLRSPEGRARVLPEVEVKLQGEAFDGTNLAYPFPHVDTFAPSPTPGYGSTTLGSFSVPAPWPGTANKVRLRTRSRSPLFPVSRWLTPGAHASGQHDVRTSGSVVAVAPPPAIERVRGAHLAAVWPNPAAGEALTYVDYALATAGGFALDVFDVRGRHVRRLAAGEAPPGPARATWDGRDDAGRRAAAGVYFVTLRAGGATDQRRFLRVR